MESDGRVCRLRETEMGVGRFGKDQEGTGLEEMEREGTGEGI